MSLLKRLFGGGRGGNTAEAAPTREAEHKGFRIEARPYAADGQYQVAGVISKEIDGEVRSHRFVRADRCPSIEDAADLAVLKARQIIDEQGERVLGQTR